MAFAAGAVTSLFLNLSIPHNLLISDKGKTIYAFPRTYEKLIDSEDIPITSIFELSGLVAVSSKQTLEQLKQEALTDFLQSQVTVQDEVYSYIKQSLKT